MEKLRKDSTEFHQRTAHPKGWGKEIWIENLPEYCGKILVMESGKKCSMHFHMDKLETMYLQSGRVDILLIQPDNGEQYTIELFPGDSFMIPRGQLHQISALKDSELFEFSTTHKDSDSYRAWKGD